MKVNFSFALGDIEVENSGVIIYETDEFLNSGSIIFLLPEHVFAPSFSFVQLLDSLNFDHKFKSGRFTQLFGFSKYKYGSTSHNPVDFSENRFINEMFEFVNTTFPDFCLNSCLINYYPDLQSAMPEHSDNESSINENSFIVTISLGYPRRIFFRDSRLGTRFCSVLLRNGSILIFSKRSQSFFTHEIPREPTSFNTDDYSPRISATFRFLE
jgi:alkylated DNA repair dioxygenase AlkB